MRPRPLGVARSCSQSGNVAVLARGKLHFTCNLELVDSRPSQQILELAGKPSQLNLAGNKTTRCSCSINRAPQALFTPHSKDQLCRKACMSTRNQGRNNGNRCGSIRKAHGRTHPGFRCPYFSDVFTMCSSVFSLKPHRFPLFSNRIRPGRPKSGRVRALAAEGKEAR